MKTFRDTMLKSLPRWLTGHQTQNERVNYVLGLLLDTTGSAFAAGMLYWWPGYYGYGSLPYLASQRKLRQGLHESNEAFANRLRLWLEAARHQGQPYELLQQIRLHYAPDYFPAELIYRSGTRFSMDVNGVITKDTTPWNPGTPAEQWAHWWLILHTDVISTASTADVEDLKAIPREWNSAHCLGTVVLLETGAFLVGYHPPNLIDEPDTVDTTTPAKVYNV